MIDWLDACRDIKPANILVHSRGLIKISDFGMSKAHLRAASSVGTLYYMSPERCMSNEYSFNAGIVLILPLLHPKLIPRYHLPAP